MNELALFAGIGGGILGGKLLGWETVCAVEIEPYCSSILAQRQNDGLLPPFPIWDDVSTFDGKPWRGIVDVISGGFPCQDISAAGKGAGIKGERSGLWKEFARIIREVRPRYAYIENSPMLTLRGLDTVLCDLAAMGFDAKWGVLGASDVGAHHKRERIWILCTNTNMQSRDAEQEREHQRPKESNGCSFRRMGPPSANANGEQLRIEQVESGEQSEAKSIDNGQAQYMANPMRERLQGVENARKTNRIRARRGEQSPGCSYIPLRQDWKLEPDVGRVANGIPARVDRLKAIGNGQVPQCAAEAWRILMGDRA